jgi:hypothetical protein
MLSDSARLRHPGTATYAANYTAKTGIDYYDDTIKIDRYPNIKSRDTDTMGDCWANNGSGFEFCKELSGQWDWYFDWTFPYINFDHLVSKTLNPTGDYPLPVGTWRRIWKNSLGRPFTDGSQGTELDQVKGLLRAFEAGDPRQGSGNNYPGNTVGEDEGSLAHHIYYPPGHFVSVAPEITEFTNWSYEIDDIKNGNILVISGDHTSDLHPGAMVYLCLSNALEDCGCTYVIKSRYIEESDTTEVAVAGATENLLPFIGYTVKGDNRLSHRHDPVQVTWNAVTSKWDLKYELTAALVNEMHDTIYGWTMLMASPQLEWRAAEKRIHVDIAGSFFDSAGGALNACRAGMCLTYSNPDDWIAGNCVYHDGVMVEGYGTGWAYPGTICYAGSFYHYDGSKHWAFVISGTTCGVLSASAVRVVSVPEWYHASTIKVSVHWHDVLQNPSYPDAQPQSAGGFSSRVVDSDPQPHYAYMNLPVNGAWVMFYPGVMAEGICIADVQDPEYPNDPDRRYTTYSGHAFIGVDIEPDPVGVGVDYNLVPESTFNRDTIAAFEIAVTPIESDILPPMPNPAVWQYDPQAYFVFKPQVDKTQATFTVSVETGYDTLTVAGRTFANGDIVSAFNVKVEGVGALPAGLAANTLYKVTDVSGSTFKLVLAADDTATAVDITDAGTGTQYIEEAGHFELRITGTLRQGWDEQSSNPVKYRMVGKVATGAPDTAWSEGRIADFLVRRLTLLEALAGVPLEGMTSMIVYTNPAWVGTRFLCQGSPVGVFAVDDEVIITNTPFYMPADFTIKALWDNDEPIFDVPMAVMQNYDTTPRLYSNSTQKFTSAVVAIGDLVYISGTHIDDPGLYTVSNRYTTGGVDYIEVATLLNHCHANGAAIVRKGGLMVDTGTFISMDMDPYRNWMLHAGEGSGYGLEDWAEEEAADYVFRPQTKDSWSEMPNGTQDNAGKLGDERAVLAPVKYPMEIWTDCWAAFPPWGG